MDFDNMKSISLSPEALQLVAQYKHLPFSNFTVLCPYFNNKTVGLRGALGVHVGKGTPREIVEEVDILLKKKGLKISEINAETIRHFLIDNKIGIDCSGFVYHTLDAELHVHHLGSLGKHLNFRVNFFRKILTKLHPAKSTSVTTLEDEDNSHEINIKSIKPGDIIILIGSGKNADRNHVLIVTRVDMNDMDITIRIHYAHSLKWNSDSTHTHGLREGVIDVKDSNLGILDQTWVEDGLSDEDNETYTKARDAERVTIRRLFCMDKKLDDIK
jgi:hypothetical protein